MYSSINLTTLRAILHTQVFIWQEPNCTNSCPVSESNFALILTGLVQLQNNCIHVYSLSSYASCQPILLAPPVLKCGHIVYDFWYDPYYSYGTKTNCPRLWTYVCCHLAINEPSFREKIPPTRWRLPVLAGPAILDQVIIFCRIIVDVVNLSNTYIDCNALALL